MPQACQLALDPVEDLVDPHLYHLAKLAAAGLEGLAAQGVDVETLLAADQLLGTAAPAALDALRILVGRAQGPW
jgi:hypothetical protein